LPKLLAGLKNQYKVDTAHIKKPIQSPLYGLVALLLSHFSYASSEIKT
jgi:hypothetical protein